MPRLPGCGVLFEGGDLARRFPQPPQAAGDKPEELGAIWPCPSDNKVAAESVGRSRRRHLPRFATWVPVRSRLLRQRRGVVDLHRAVGAVAGQAVAVRAEEHTAAPALL